MVCIVTANYVHLFPTVCSVLSIGNLKSATVGVLHYGNKQTFQIKVLPSQKLIDKCLQHPTGYKSHKRKLLESPVIFKSVKVS